MNKTEWENLPVKPAPAIEWFTCPACEGKGISKILPALPCHDCRNAGWLVVSPETLSEPFTTEQQALTFCFYNGITIESAAAGEADRDSFKLTYPMRQGKFQFSIRGFTFLGVVNELVSMLIKLGAEETGI